MPPTSDMPGLPDFPLLSELDKTIRLIVQAFSPSQTENAAAPSEIDETTPTRWLVADAFSNQDYVRFALKGSLAASISYVLYSAIDWPGISTAVLTCLAPALSTLGASQQLQFFRIKGATFSGLLAIFSIVFLLPLNGPHHGRRPFIGRGLCGRRVDCHLLTFCAMLMRYRIQVLSLTKVRFELR